MNTRLTMLLTATALLLFPASRVRADDDTTLGMLVDDVIQEVKHDGYVCVTRPNCAVTIVNQSMALVGCLSGCSGDCYYCTATGVTTFACVKRNGQCTFGGEGTTGSYTCGNKFKGKCANGSPSNTYLHDINGCVCTLTAGNDTGDACTLAKCY